MDNSPKHKASESDIDHRLRGVDPLLVIANEAFPARHPTEGALDDPCVDGPSLQEPAHVFDRIPCVHMFGLLLRLHMTAGQDGLRSASSKQRRDL